MIQVRYAAPLDRRQSELWQCTTRIGGALAR
jgi:hypothetical protein